jgi:hypothetical protein
MKANQQREWDALRTNGLLGRIPVSIGMPGA